MHVLGCNCYRRHSDLLLALRILALKQSLHCVLHGCVALSICILDDDTIDIAGFQSCDLGRVGIHADGDHFVRDARVLNCQRNSVAGYIVCAVDTNQLLAVGSDLVLNIRLCACKVVIIVESIQLSE